VIDATHPDTPVLPEIAAKLQSQQFGHLWAPSHPLSAFGTAHKADVALGWANRLKGWAETAAGNRQSHSDALSEASQLSMPSEPIAPTQITHVHNYAPRMK
jgi:hypothetical protein